jgi:hypothetical protein
MSSDRKCSVKITFSGLYVYIPGPPLFPPPLHSFSNVKMCSMECGKYATVGFINAKCHSAIDHEIVGLCSDSSKMHITSHSMSSFRDYVLALILSLESSE